jgi:hypothetical protein
MYILCKSITRRSKRVEVLSVMFNVVYIQEHNEFNPGVEYAPCNRPLKLSHATCYNLRVVLCVNQSVARRSKRGLVGY